MADLYSGNFEFLQSISNLQTAQSYVASGRFSQLSVFRKSILTLEGYYTESHSVDNPQVEVVLEMALVSVPPMDVYVMIKKKHKVMKNLHEIAYGQLLEVTHLQMRPEKFQNEKVVLMLGSTKKTVQIIQEIVRIAALTSPMSRATKRQSAASRESASQGLPVPMTPLRISPFKPQRRPAFTSLTSLLTVDFSHESNTQYIYCLESIINIKDEVNFDAVVLRIDEETDRHNGFASRVVIVRDVECNDVAKVVVYYSTGEMRWKGVDIFSVVRLERAYRVVSTSLNVYFRLYLDSYSSLSLLSPHPDACAQSSCPCRSLSLEPSKAATHLQYPADCAVFLPAIHSDEIPQRYFANIAFDRLERAYFRSHCTIAEVTFLMLEVACTVCAKRAVKAEEVMCPACAAGSMDFNMRAGVLLDDSSGVVSEGVLETLDLVRRALFMTPANVSLLKTILEESGQAVLSLTGNNIPEWLRTAVVANGAREAAFVVQCQSYVRQTEHLTDSYMRYLHNCVLPSTVSLNRKPTDCNVQRTRPYVKVASVRSPLSFLLVYVRL